MVETILEYYSSYTSIATILIYPNSNVSVTVSLELVFRDITLALSTSPVCACSNTLVKLWRVYLHPLLPLSEMTGLNKRICLLSFFGPVFTIHLTLTLNGFVKATTTLQVSANNACTATHRYFFDYVGQKSCSNIVAWSGKLQ